MSLPLYGLLVLCALGLVSCGDEEESTYKTENCAVVTAGGQTVELCCRLKCEAIWDDDEFRERCVEETTCTTATGGPCPLSIVQAVRFPPCLY